MALALSLNADGHGELDPTLQSLYVKQDDGNYRLDAEFPNNDGLKAKADELLSEKKREQELRKAAEERAKALEEAQQKALEDNARARGDVDSLTKSHEERIAKINEQSSNELSVLRKQIYELTVGQTANSISNELAIKGSAIAILPHVQNRLSLDTDNEGNQKLWVLDANGKKTDMTIEELKQEFRANEAFKPLIAANGASGSGANGANSGAGGQFDATTLTALERKQLFDTDPEKFKRLFP